MVRARGKIQGNAGRAGKKIPQPGRGRRGADDHAWRKRLEYDTVFIIQGNEGSIPYKKAKSTDDIEEERRLFYVAMTRAKRKLIISYVKEKTGKA